MTMEMPAPSTVEAPMSTEQYNSYVEPLKNYYRALESSDSYEMIGGAVAYLKSQMSPEQYHEMWQPTLDESSELQPIVYLLQGAKGERNIGDLKDRLSVLPLLTPHLELQEDTNIEVHDSLLRLIVSRVGRNSRGQHRANICPTDEYDEEIQCICSGVCPLKTVRRYLVSDALSISPEDTDPTMARKESIVMQCKIALDHGLISVEYYELLVAPFGKVKDTAPHCFDSVLSLSDMQLYKILKELDTPA